MNEALKRSFEGHPQTRYSQDINWFQQVHFAYYLSTASLSNAAAEEGFQRDRESHLFLPSSNADFAQNIEKLENYSPDVVIVTSTHDRIASLQRLHVSIARQRFRGRIAWLIIANGAPDTTVRQLSEWSRHHRWVVCLQYRSALGYAAPARNRGLAFVQMCLHKCYKTMYTWAVDSDDHLHNDFAVRELYAVAQRHPAVMTHGYAAVRYQDDEGRSITVNTIPRNIGRSFPAVLTLKDELEMGPQVLSGLLPCAYLPHFYYPDEFTMEDDTLNRRIMAYAFKYRLKIGTVTYPCLLKTFHANSMTKISDAVGRQDVEAHLGPRTVRGIRAQIVLGLQYMRDYFTREGV